MPFSYEDYNKLLEINDAHIALRDQLDSAGAKLQDLIKDDDITKLLCDYDYQFGICILHRHALLEPGERMVSESERCPDPCPDPFESCAPPASIAKPSTSCSPAICAERWMRNGDEFEHTIPCDCRYITPPSPEFFRRFQVVCDRYKVDILGICSAHMDFVPNDDQVYLELPYGPEKMRAQKTTLVWKKDIKHREVRQSAWVPVCRRIDCPAFNAGNSVTEKLTTMKCSHNCGHSEETLAGPTMEEKIEFTADIPPVLKGVPTAA